MLIPFLIMLREGLEAALIVGIVASYLAQTGRGRLLPLVWAGVGSAVGLCLAVGVGLDLASAEFPQAQQELFAGAVALLAALVLTSMVFWMHKAARSIKGELHASVDTALKPGGSGWALVGMVFLAVGREGLESVFFLLATFQQGEGWAAPAGALLGVVGAVAIGYAIYRGGVRLNLRLFFRWTGVFIIFVAAGLLASGLRSLHEAGVWDHLQTTAFDLSTTIPNDGVAGTLLSGLFGYSDTPTAGEVLIYLAYLVPALLLLGGGVRRPLAVRRAVCLAALLPLAAHAADMPAGPVSIVVTDRGCVPNALSVVAGKTTFRVKNESRRALEWEILRGVSVVAERENILPGFTQPLSATLAPGEYEMTCGLLSNPKGRVTVSGSRQDAIVTPEELTLPIAQYKAYVVAEADALVTSTAAFTTAVKAGHLAEAQRLYAPARAHYERIEPVAELFDDLDKSMDARVDDFEKKEADPAWTGFHRLEQALWVVKSTAGMEATADTLAADTVELRRRLETLDLPPKAVVGGAASLIEEVAAKKISGEEDRYSHTDLWDFQANTDGAQKVFGVLKPLVSAKDPQLVARVDGNFARVDATLAKYRHGGGFEDYDKLSSADKNALKRPITALAEDLSTLRGKLGVE